MSDVTPSTPRPRRVRFAPVALLGGAAASAVLALSLSGSLAAFTASITNSSNTAASGTLTMQETGGSFTCNSTDSTTVNVNSATCSTINKYGGSTTMVPGTPVTTTITIKNTGTVPANTFTLSPQACQPGTNGAVNGNATDVCSKVNVAVSEQIGSGTAASVVATKTLTAFASGGAVTLNGPIAAGATATFVFTVTLDSSAGNTYQGLSVSQPLIWTFTS